MIIGLLMLYSGLSTLLISMDDSMRHHRQSVWFEWPHARCLVAWSLIAVSFAYCLLHAQGAGIVTWFGFLSISGVLLAVLRPYVPRAIRVLAVAAVGGSIIATILQVR